VEVSVSVPAADASSCFSVSLVAAAASAFALASLSTRLLPPWCSLPRCESCTLVAVVLHQVDAVHLAVLVIKRQFLGRATAKLGAALLLDDVGHR